MNHAQVIGIILCFFSNCSIIYLVGTVYSFPGHPSNTITSGALKFYAGSKKVVSETLEHSDFEFFYPQGSSWGSLNQIQNNIDYIQIEIFKVKPHKDSNIFVPTVCAL